MKDEFKGKIISEFVAISQLVIDRDSEEVKKAKGVNKNVVKKIRQRIF